ncbi:MAG: hypothetical protein QME21_11585 [Anaerolineales bacterium]|nr:hypothetical protein [Anaerolineales bacterium]
MSQDKVPLLVEIIAYAPTAYYHCTHCEVAFREMGVSNNFHREQLDSSLPADLAAEYQKMSDWVRDLFRRYCDQVVVQVIDAASVEGFIKSLRYKTRKFPAIIVARKARFSHGDYEQADVEIARLLGVQLQAVV